MMTNLANLADDWVSDLLIELGIVRVMLMLFGECRYGKKIALNTLESFEYFLE